MKLEGGSSARWRHLGLPGLIKHYWCAGDLEIVETGDEMPGGRGHLVKATSFGDGN